MNSVITSFLWRFDQSDRLPEQAPRTGSQNWSDRLPLELVRLAPKTGQTSSQNWLLELVRLAPRTGQNWSCVCVCAHSRLCICVCACVRTHCVDDGLVPHFDLEHGRPQDVAGIVRFDFQVSGHLHNIISHHHTYISHSFNRACEGYGLMSSVSLLSRPTRELE